jgi:hypothetical protein
MDRAKAYTMTVDRDSFRDESSFAIHDKVE